jgi:uncharacterized protein YbcI
MSSDDWMKGNSASPGGSLTGKPAWSNTFGVFHHAGFFACGRAGQPQATGEGPMDKNDSSMAQQIAEAAIRFAEGQTGHLPQSATVVLGDDTLVVTLHGALSPAEQALARTPAGAAQVQEFHRQLFNSSAESLRQEIQRITGVAVREATAEVEMMTGTVVHAFTTGTMVQVFLLAPGLTAESWRGSGPVDPS